MHAEPITCYRPRPESAAEFSSLPYDVFDRGSASAFVAAHPSSFLAVERPESTFPPEQDMYAPEVYAKGAELLHERIDDGTLMCDPSRSYYIYELTQAGHTQTGVVAVCSIDEYEQGIINMKVRKSTRNYLHEAAMTEEEMELCLERGAEVVKQCHAEGCNVISFGEMGIANTSASSMWMTYFTGIELSKCVGAGSGLDNAGIRHKYEVLKQAMDNYKGDASPRDIIRYFGGYEMVMAVGAMLQAAELKMVILVDGFIMTNCMLAASKLYPEVTAYAIYGHCGDETGHKLVLDAMGAKPLLNLGLRLGEGTGAVCAYPIVVSAVRMINEMDNFAHASITKYF